MSQLVLLKMPVIYTLCTFTVMFRLNCRRNFIELAIVRVPTQCAVCVCVCIGPICAIACVHEDGGIRISIFI
jgi:hypothetical protein